MLRKISFHFSVFKSNQKSLLKCCNVHSCRNYTTINLARGVTFVSNDNLTTLQGNNGPYLSKYHNNKGRPLSIIKPWFFAKQRPVDKFVQLYLNKGFDVLTITVTPLQMLFPHLLEKFVLNEVLPILLSSNHDDKVLHIFCAGGCIFSRVLRHAYSTPDGRVLLNSIKSQIHNSILDVPTMTSGASIEMLKRERPPLHRIFWNYMDFHINFADSNTAKYLRESQDYFYKRPLAHAPALIFSSEVDKISPSSVNEGVVDSWRGCGMKVEHVVWSNVEHVEHMKVNPKEYERLMWEHLRKCGVNLEMNLEKNETEEEMHLHAGV